MRSDGSLGFSSQRQTMLGLGESKGIHVVHKKHILLGSFRLNVARGLHSIPALRKSAILQEGGRSSDAARLIHNKGATPARRLRQGDVIVSSTAQVVFGIYGLSWRGP